MVEKIRKSLGITGERLDEEVTDTIDACYRDMYRVGINVYNSDKKTVKASIANDPLVLECQKLHAKWKFDFENHGERYEKAYVSCRNGMSLSGEYR